MSRLSTAVTQCRGLRSLQSAWFLPSLIDTPRSCLYPPLCLMDGSSRVKVEWFWSQKDLGLYLPGLSGTHTLICT